MSTVDCSREATAHRYAQVAEMTAAGMTAAQIADALGVTRRSVSRARSATGCARPVPRHLNPSDFDTARQMLDDGCSYTEVARALGCDLKTIRQRFPGRGWTLKQTNEHIAALRKFGA